MNPARREQQRRLTLKRKIFSLRHGEWLSSQEIAAALNVAVSTARRVANELAICGLFEEKKQSNRGHPTYLYRAIMPLETEITFETIYRGNQPVSVLRNPSKKLDMPTELARMMGYTDIVPRLAPEERQYSMNRLKQFASRCNTRIEYSLTGNGLAMMEVWA